MKRNITLDQMFKICSKPKSRKEPHEKYFKILKIICRVIDFMANKNSQFEFIHFVLPLSNNEIYTIGNNSIIKFTESLTRYSENNNICIKYLWNRETSLSGNSHQYRVFLLCEVQNEMSSSIILNKANELWMKLLKTNIPGQIKFSLTDNRIMVDRNLPEYMDTIEKCIFTVSHFAKDRSNGFCPSGVRNFGSSRV